MMAEKKDSVKKHGFLQGALILTAGMLTVKIIGAFFKIPLKHAIGEYGMGLFNTAYNFYGPIFSLTTAGFPVAVSRIVSQYSAQGRSGELNRVKKAAGLPFVLFGIFGMLLITAFAPLYCRYVIGNYYALIPMLALAPSILFSCISSIYRGYYEGMRNMTPTAVSEIVEAVSKLLLGLSASKAVSYLCTLEYEKSRTVLGMAFGSPDETAFFIVSLSSAAAILGVTFGSVLSALYLCLKYHLSHRRGLEREDKNTESVREIRKKLLKTAVPIAIGSVAMNIAGLVDATFLQGRISYLVRTDLSGLLGNYSGMIPDLYTENPSSLPTFFYGCYTLALTLYLLVPAVTQAFGISALPNVTAAWISGNRDKFGNTVDSVLKITAMFCFPAGIGMCALSGPICAALYGSDATSDIAAHALSILAAAALPAAMCTPVSSVLQAIGRVDIPVKLLVVAMGIKIAVNYVLCGIPEINILGAGIGTFLCYTYYLFSQIYYIKKLTGIKLSAGTYIRQLLAALLCSTAARLLYSFAVSAYTAGEKASYAVLALSICAAAVLYVLFLLLFKGVDKKMLEMLPMGQKIRKMLENWELI